MLSQYYYNLKTVLTPEVLGWASLLSVVMMVATLLISGFLLLRLPKDYFLRHEDVNLSDATNEPRWLRVLVRFAKNVVGIILVLAGVLMLVLPGQGMLTIIAALLLLDFPGKHKLIGRLVANPKVQGGMNLLREKFKKEKFVFRM